MATAHEPPSTAPRSVRESQWRYGAVAYLLFSLLPAFVAVPLSFVALLWATGYGASFLVVSVLSALVALFGVALAVLLPVSIYKDGQTILESSAEWEPDVTLLTMLGVVGVLVSPLGMVVAIYYLYKRHEQVRIP